MGWALLSSLQAGTSKTEQIGLADMISVSRSLSANVAANRKLWDAPAGPVIVNFQGQMSRLKSTVDEGVDFGSRNDRLGASLHLPLSRRADAGAPIARGVVGAGAVTLGLGAAARFMDKGRGDEVNAGLTWAPFRKLNLNLAWLRSVDAPSDIQLQAPITLGDPVTIFDFVTGTSVQVAPLVGGNPDLMTPTRESLSFGVSAGPFTDWNLMTSVSVQQASTAHSIETLPYPTSEIEAVFPERFMREDGRLVRIDLRPVNFESRQADTLSSSIAFDLPRNWASADGIASAQISINHGWRLSDTVSIREGLNRLDALAGDGGGMSRHDLSAQFDIRRGRWSARAIARWRSGYRVRARAGLDGPEDLDVSAFGAGDIRITYLMPRPGGDASARRSEGVQLTFDIDNIGDARPSARLGDGRPAPGYGRNDQDPIGRTIKLSVSGRF